QQAHFHGPNEISLRTLRMGYELASVDAENWQDLLLKGLPTPDAQQVVLDLNRSSMKVKEKEILFTKQTGFQRRKFYQIRDQLGLASAKRSQAAKVIALSRVKAKQARKGVR